MDVIAHVRELETQVLADPKHSNHLIAIKKHLKDKSNGIQIRLASLHALRRIFISFLEKGKLCAPKSKSAGDVKSEYAVWLQQQLHGYVDELCKWVTSGDAELQAPAILTLLEIVKRESLEHKASGAIWFGTKTFRRLMRSFLSADEHDVEVLLMMRDEVFERPDCAYFGLKMIREAIQDFKDGMKDSGGLTVGDGGDSDSDSDIDGSGSGIISEETKEFKSKMRGHKGFVQNVLDLMRVVILPDGFEETSFLMPNVGGGEDDAHRHGLEVVDTDSDEEEEKEKGGKKRGRFGRGSVPLAKKPKAKAKSTGERQTLSQKLHDRECYRRSFSKAWTLLLSLPLTATQHRLVLRHLPDNVIPELLQPLLLADYLTKSYEMGGALAVLALESLFKLIVEHNLDYPKFFLSLYRLCTYRIFAAKYRAKYMRLLNVSLQSTNLPVYVVAAFAKRLMILALSCPSPSAAYCIAQVTWLLRKHPEAQVLIHKSTSSSASASSSSSSSKGKGNGTGGDVSDFDNFEEEDLERTGALGNRSSLWEAALLSRHHVPAVAALASSLRLPGSTAAESLIGKKGLDEDEQPILINVREYLDTTYASLMDEELARARTGTGAAMAVHKPLSLFDETGDVTRKCFGML